MSVPLVALVDSDTSGIEDIMFPVISSSASHRSSFVIFRLALRGRKLNFSFRKLYSFLLLGKKKRPFVFKRVFSYLSRRFWQKRLAVTVFKKSRRWLKRYKSVFLYKFSKRFRRFFFFFNIIEKKKQKRCIKRIKKLRKYSLLKGKRNPFYTLMLSRKAVKRLLWLYRKKAKSRKKKVFVKKKKIIKFIGKKRRSSLKKGKKVRK